MSTAIPSFKWAEDGERLFLTIELPSATDVSVQLQPTHFSFKARSGSAPTVYALDFELPKSIDPTKSTWSVKGRQVEVALVKAEDSEGWWHSLLKDKSQYKGRVKIDWDLWRDEDEEKSVPDDFGGLGGMGGGMPGMGGMGGAGGMDMAKMMAGMGGMGGAGGGMGGMNFGDMGGMGDEDADSDDEEPPGLDDKETTEGGEGKGAPEEAEKEDEESHPTKA